MYDDLKPYINALRQLAAKFMAMQLELESYPHLQVMTLEQLEAIAVLCDTIEKEIPDMYDYFTTIVGELRQRVDRLECHTAEDAAERIALLESYRYHTIEPRFRAIETDTSFEQYHNMKDLVMALRDSGVSV